jgi:hypothetical protein
MAKGSKKENRVVTFWLPAIGIGLVVAALAGALVWWWMTPYDSGDGTNNIWHAKVKKSTQAATTVASTTDVSADLKTTDASLSNLDSALKDVDTALADQQTNLN